MPDPYEVLGIQSGASPEEMSAAFKTLAQIYHPDRYENSPQTVRDEANRRMKEITAAYQTLMDAVPKEVVYKTKGWDNRRKAYVTEGLLDVDVPHSWKGDYLSVARQFKQLADNLVFQKPAPEHPSEDHVTYYTDEWTNEDRGDLTQALLDANVPHGWEDEQLFIAPEFESIVDSILYDRES